MSQSEKNQLAMQLGLRPRTVTLLFISLALLILPHATVLPVWTLVITFVFMLWRFQHERRGWPLPGRMLRILLMMLVVIGIIISYGNPAGRLPFTALFVTLLGMKFIELRTRRDLMVILFLGYFVAITHFLDNQNIAMAAYILGVIILLTTALVSFNRKQDIRAGELKADARLALNMLMQAVPIMLILFVLFPRLSAPLWAIPTDGASGVTGLSDEMSPGQISSLTRSSAIAFRVDFHGGRPEASQLYWRGPVFTNYDGYRWSKSNGFHSHRLKLINTSKKVEYSITLEANNKPWLLTLDLPTHMVLNGFNYYPLNRSGHIPSIGKVSDDYQITSGLPVTSRKKYRMVSSLQYQTPELSVKQWQDALQLPDNIGDKLISFSQQLREKYKSDARIVDAMLAYFTGQEFFYTLQPEPLGYQPMQQFLFETREGFCEHYASAFTLVMRAAGIPARVVTGYQSSEINPYGDYLVVRQSDAHAWSEVWLDDRGWVRVDPTAAVAPERIKQGLEALPEFSISPVILGDNTVLARAWLTMSRSWDAVNNVWYQFVLGYDYAEQRELLKKFGLNNLHIVPIAITILVAIAALLGLFALFMFRPKQQKDTVGMLYERFCNIMEKRGLPRNGHEGPRNYCNRLLAACPELAPQVNTITSAYIRYRYARSQRSDEAQRIRQSIRALQRSTQISA